MIRAQDVAYIGLLIFYFSDLQDTIFGLFLNVIAHFKRNGLF